MTALEKYGRHFKGCPVGHWLKQTMRKDFVGRPACQCGLDRELEAAYQAKGEILQLRAAKDAAELRRLELELERVVPGRYRCDRCQFELTSTILDISTGRVGVAIAPQAEDCPNGCGPLRPYTWREDAKSGDAALERLFGRIERLEAAGRALIAKLKELFDDGGFPALDWRATAAELEARIERPFEGEPAPGPGGQS